MSSLKIGCGSLEDVDACLTGSGGGAPELVECIAWHWPSYSHSYLNFTNNIAVAARLWTLVKGQYRTGTQII